MPKDMTFLNNETMVEFAIFVKRCKGKRVALLIDKDLDGISSGVNMFKCLQNVGAIVDESWVIPLKSPTYFNEDVVKLVERLDVEVVITLDLSLDQSAKHVFEIAERVEFGIVDHHWSSGVFLQKVNYLNPIFFQKQVEAVHYPTSKLAFDVSAACSCEPVEWIAVLGMMADMSVKEWPELCNKVFDEFGKEKMEALRRKLDFARMSGLDAVKKIFLLVNSASSPNEILNLSDSGESLMQDAAVNEKLFLNLRKKMYDKLEKYDDVKLAWFEFKSTKDGMATLLANELSFKFEDYTTVLVNVAGDKVFMSLRNQAQKVDMNVLIRKSIEGLENANGGGHKPAAGGSVKTSDLQILKENIKENLKKGAAKIA